jgi:hypothetical protein
MTEEEKAAIDEIVTRVYVRIDVISDEITKKYQGFCLSDSGKISLFPYVFELKGKNSMNALDIALEKTNTAEDAVRYFIGIAKNWIRDGVRNDRLTTRGGN